MFKLLSLVLRIAFFIFIALLVAAFFTNPTLEDFQHEVRDQVQVQLDRMIEDPTLSVIAQMGSQFSDDMVEKLITRKNYYVCSVYTIELPDGDYRYLGAYHLFYPLQNENPLDQFIKKFESLN